MAHFNLDTENIFGPSVEASSSTDICPPGTAGNKLDALVNETLDEWMNLPIRCPIEAEWIQQRTSLPANASLETTHFSPPEMVITVPPIEQIRFRYPTETPGKHGNLHGCTATVTKMIGNGFKEKFAKKYMEYMSNANYSRSCITVRLKNFQRAAIIRCTLQQVNDVNKDSAAPVLHWHKLYSRGGTRDYHDEPVIQNGDNPAHFEAVFNGISIIYTSIKQIGSLIYKNKLSMEKSKTIPKDRRVELEKMAQMEARSVNLHQVRLGFQAFEEINGELVSICKPIFSEPISNLKSSKAGELKIVLMSGTSGSAVGGEELFLFVERVAKGNIQVHFVEANENGEILWSDEGKFAPSDVHHQFGIVLKTPMYRNRSIRKDVTVYVVLRRPNNGAISNLCKFTYKSVKDYIPKRQRYDPRTDEHLKFI